MDLDEIKRLLDGEGEALDPSKAMGKEVSRGAQHLDHALYILTDQSLFIGSSYKLVPT